MSSWTYPDPVGAFLQALQVNDALRLLGTIRQDTVLVDGGRAYPGSDILLWAEHVLLPEPATIRAINHEHRDGQTVVTILLGRGADLAVGGPSDWQFQLEDGWIRRICIEPCRTPDLPLPIGAFIRATNSCSLDALLQTFVQDALVNDQLRDHWGADEIREWARQDIIGQRLTIHIVKSICHYGQTIVTANIGGDFDKRGLPDPLIMDFYFSASNERIVQLMILRNQLGS